MILLFHNGWESPGVFPVIVYLMLQSYRLMQSRKICCRVSKLPASQPCMIECLLFGSCCICAPTAARNSHETLLLYHLGLQVPQLVTACVAAPQSMCSRCVSYLHMPDVRAISVSEGSAAWVCSTLIHCCIHTDIAYDYVAWSSFKGRQVHALQHSAEQCGHAAMKVP